MPRYLLYLTLLTTTSLYAQQDTLYGDLTNDGLPEMLVTVRHPEPIIDTLNGTEILETATVYRKLAGNWRPWPAATGFLMHAYNEAGMARFYPRIERGALVLVHGKSGHINWVTTHRFRFQNGRFELIGYTQSRFDRCEGSELFDYNLSTGRYTYTESTWECDDDWNLDDGQTTTNSKEGKMPPERVFLLSEGGYLEFALPRFE